MKTSKITFVIGALGGLGLLAGFASWCCLPRQPDPLPVIDTRDVTPAVKRAIEFYRHAVESDAQSGLAWGRFGMVLSAHEYAAAAMECYRNAERLDRSDVRWPYLLGVGLENYDPEASLAAYREAMARDPNAILPRLRMAEMLMLLQKLDEAEACLRNLLKAAPDQPRVRYRLAQLLFQRGRLEEAVTMANAARVLSPRQKSIAELLVQIEHAMRQRGMPVASPSAVDVAGATETAWPDQFLEEVQALRRDPYWLALHAGHLIKSGQVAEGLTELEQAVSEADRDWTLKAQLAQAYLQARRLDDAERLLNQSLERFPDVADFFRLRGTVELLRNRWSHAIDDYRRAISLKPDDAAAHADLGFCLQQSNDLEQARREFAEALRLDPSLDGARIQFAKLLLQMRDFQAARDAVENLLRTNPDHAEAKIIMERAGVESAK